MAEPQLNAIVTAKVNLSPRLMILRVATDGWPIPDFEPGQFVAVGLPGSAPRYRLSEEEIKPSAPGKLIRRAYSVASSSRTREYFEFFINLVSNGALTPRLFALEVGDRLWLSSKVTGMFTLDQVPEDKHIVMIATGTGLAPYMSMLGTDLACGRPRRYAVLHGAYHSWDLGYRSELLNLEHLCSNFTYIATIDRPEEEPVPWGGQVGWVQDLWAKGVLAQAWGFQPTPADSHVFLCGNPGMIESMETLLEAEGFHKHSPKSPGEIHAERF
jgi:ferredoxin--NADP+ reductase